MIRSLVASLLLSTAAQAAPQPAPRPEVPAAIALLTAPQASVEQLLAAWYLLRSADRTALILSGDRAAFDPAEQANAIAARLLDAAAQRPALLFALLTEAPRSAPAPIAAQARARLAELDADNLAVQLLLTPSAADAAASAWLDAAAAATRYDGYDGPLLRALHAGLATVPLDLLEAWSPACDDCDAADRRAALVFELAAARAAPELAAWRAQCGAPTLAAATLHRRKACITMARTLRERGDRLDIAELGARLLHEVVRDGSHAESLRRLRWQLDAYLDLTADMHRDLHGGDALLAHVSREGVSLRAIQLEQLAGAGIGLQPPRGWQPTPNGTLSERDRQYSLASARFYDLLAAALAQQGDARSLLAAALLLRQAQFGRHHADGDALPVPPLDGTLARRALAHADQPAVLYALALEPGLGLHVHERSEALQRLRLHDPHNLVPILLGIDEHDDDALRRRLHRLPADLRHASHYWHLLGAAMYAALQSVDVDQHVLVEHWSRSGLGAESDRDAAIGMTAVALQASTMLPLAGFSRVCNADGADWQETDRAVCTRAARLLAQHGDSVLLQSIGLRLWHRLVAGSDEEAMVSALHRDAEWRKAAWMHQQHAISQAAQFASVLADLQGPARSELDRLHAELRAAGIPLQAPPGWQPERPLQTVGAQQAR